MGCGGGVALNEPGSERWMQQSQLQHEPGMGPITDTAGCGTRYQFRVATKRSDGRDVTYARGGASRKDGGYSVKGSMAPIAVIRGSWDAGATGVNIVPTRTLCAVNEYNATTRARCWYT